MATGKSTQVTAGMFGDSLPTWRSHNEQTMAHTAIAYAKAARRRKAMAVTTSIGPGATNVVTAAALAVRGVVVEGVDQIVGAA